METSNISSSDFSHLSIQDRMAQGRDIGEKFIKDELLKHGIKIVSVENSRNIDAKLKIDGFLNGNPNEPVQIKLRKTSRGGDDIAYEVVRNYNPQIPIKEQLKDIHHQGRDYRGTSIKHYFVLNQSETEIYHIPAIALKNAVDQAITEAVTVNGKPFRSSQGVELRATVDNDPDSFTKDKLMAFIPAEKVANKSYGVGQGQIQPTYGANIISKKDFNVASAADRLQRLQAKQKFANELRKKGYRGLSDDQIIAKAAQDGIVMPQS